MEDVKSCGSHYQWWNPEKKRSETENVILGVVLGAALGLLSQGLYDSLKLGYTTYFPSLSSSWVDVISATVGALIILMGYAIFWKPTKHRRRVTAQERTHRKRN